MSAERRVYINNDLDIVTARMQAREMARQVGFGTADQARISLAGLGIGSNFGLDAWF